MDWFRRNLFLSSWRNKKSHTNTNTNKNVRINPSAAVTETHGRLDDFINITEGSEIIDSEIGNVNGNGIENDKGLKKDGKVNDNDNVDCTIVEDVIFEPVDQAEIQPIVNSQGFDSADESISNIVAGSGVVDIDINTNNTSDSTLNSNTNPPSSPSPSTKNRKYIHRPQPKKFLNSHQQQEHFRNIVIQQPR